MITDIKVKDLNRLAKEGIDGTQLYYILDQAADKIRAIYAMFGWNQSRDDMFDTEHTLVELTMHCITNLAQNPKSRETCAATGGINVGMSLEEGFDTFTLEVTFNIIS